MYHIGIDLGGTKIEWALLDHKYNVLKRQRLPTPNSYHLLLKTIQNIIRDTGTESHTIGMGTPGIVGDDGLVLCSNLEYIRDKPLKRDIEQALHTDIYMDNDANCFVAAEAALGAGISHDVIFGVIMGTGVGGGISINGRVVRGKSGMAGEWGHCVLYPGGIPCWCGKRGCTEAYISGPALRQKWYAQTGLSMDIPDIIRQRPPGYTTWKNSFLNDFALALSNIIQVLDPDCVILGGGLSNIDFLYDKGADIIHELTPHNNTAILRNKLGDSAGVLGAAILGVT